MRTQSFIGVKGAMNMGAWNTARHYIDRTLNTSSKRRKCKYVGKMLQHRTGNLNKHLAEQKILEKVISK